MFEYMRRVVKETLIDSALNSLGEENWELCAITSVYCSRLECDCFEYIFKRLKVPQPLVTSEPWPYDNPIRRSPLLQAVETSDEVVTQ